MGMINNSIDYSRVMEYAKRCRDLVDRLESANDQFDENVPKLQKYWKTKNANRVYKKLKGNINNTYKWIPELRELNETIIEQSRKMISNISD